MDLDYDISQYNYLKNYLFKWKALLVKTMTNEKEDRLNLIFVVEKITEMRSYMENAFRSMLKIFSELGIINNENIEEWKNTNIKNCGYKTYLEGFILINEDFHEKLKGEYDS